MKQQYRYRITVEPMTPTEEVPAGPSTPLRFESASHEEILERVQRSRQWGEFDEDSAAALTVGVKLLGGVMLQNREHPLFEAFHPHFGQFMKRLKGSIVAAAP
ncbi:MAG: DUF3861 domain-containing protein [Candidatus Accumulibacter sp.]|jgi:hypothetical protein|nr:DUF3861 domain-containing protein [Accumulibacter sp.]